MEAVRRVDVDSARDPSPDEKDELRNKYQPLFLSTPGDIARQLGKA